MRDTNYVLRAASVGNLVTTYTGSWVELYGLPADGGLDLYVHVPAVSAADTLDIIFQDSANGSTAIDTLHTFKQITDATAVPILLHARLTGYRRWGRILMTVGTGGAAANFGAVEAWLAAGPFKIAGE